MWLAILFAWTLATSVVRASPLYVGITASDVAAFSFGVSNISRAVGAAPDGTIYVGFVTQDRKQIRVAKSVDRGATFGASALVDTAAGSAAFSNAWLTVNSAGDVLVAYLSDSNVLFARSSNGGASYAVSPALGATSNILIGVRVATQGDHVYVGYQNATGSFAVAASANAGVSFGVPVPVTITGGNNALLVDQTNGDVVVGGENASLYLRVSHDHGATFDAQQQPVGQVFYSNWTISSDVSGRYVWVAGTHLATDNAYQINLGDFTSVQRDGFLGTNSSSARSLSAAGCGEVVDSVNSQWAVIRDFGATTGTTYTINGTDQTTAINPYNGDVLIAYRSSSDIKVDVYKNELNGCGPRVSATVTDAHAFGRFGRTSNYLVTVSDEFTAANSVAVTLSTPGTALDLANALWQCIGSDPSVLCPASSGTGASLGSVALQPASTMTWIVSVPVRTATTDETAELDLDATGAATANDVDELLIFRAGFDVINSDGTQ